jgi:Ca2+-transporting ATPase
MSWQFVLDENLFLAFSNKPLLGALLLTVFLQLMIIYVPFFNVIFKTQLSLYELILTLLSSSIVFLGGRNSEMDLT